MEVLRTKYPDSRPPSAAILDTYPDRPLELVPVDITEETLTEVAGRLSVGAGDRGYGLGKPTTLYHEIWSGERRVAADGGRFCGVVSKRATPLGRLPCVN